MNRRDFAARDATDDGKKEAPRCAHMTTMCQRPLRPSLSNASLTEMFFEFGAGIAEKAMNVRAHSAWKAAIYNADEENGELAIL